MLYSSSKILTLALSFITYARAVAVPAPESQIFGACGISSGDVFGCELDGSGLIYGCDYGSVSSLENAMQKYSR